MLFLCCSTIDVNISWQNPLFFSFKAYLKSAIIASNFNFQTSLLALVGLNGQPLRDYGKRGKVHWEAGKTSIQTLEGTLLHEKRNSPLKQQYNDEWKWWAIKFFSDCKENHLNRIEKMYDIQWMKFDMSFHTDPTITLRRIWSCVESIIKSWKLILMVLFLQVVKFLINCCYNGS